jgi:hypothetical protein
MSSLDESLRDAFRGIADEIPADALPPLILPPRRRRRHGPIVRGARPPGPRRTRVWLAAASSAVVVAAVIAAATGIAGGLNGRQSQDRLQAGVSPTRAGQPITTVTASASATPPPRPPGDVAVPAYYVALTQPRAVFHPDERTYAVVRATMAGTVIATVTAPRPYTAFTEITAAADDRSWVLSAQKITSDRSATQPTRLFVLHVNPATRTAALRARLTPLPLSYLPAGSQAWKLALSPDGTRLAVAVAANTKAISTGAKQLQVVDLVTGTRRLYSGKTGCSGCVPAALGLGFGISAEDGWLSWAADDRTLAFSWSGTDVNNVRLLNTAAPGTSLLANSRLAVTAPQGPGSYWLEVLLTADGKTIVAAKGITKHRPGGGLSVRAELLRFSAATGKLAGVLSDVSVHVDYEQVLWASDSGSTLVVTGLRNGPGAGILRGGHYTAIPWSTRTLTAAW